MNAPILYDITIPVHDGLAVWPGDTEYRFALGWTMAGGDSVNVGSVTMSVHTGTHVDAPFHYRAAGPGVDTLDLTIFTGPARVVEATGLRVIPCAAFADVDGAQTPRVLVKTGAWTDYSRFPESVPVLADDVPAFLAARGVRLLGVDVPSVDALDSKSLPVHHALGAHGITILESVDLRAVPPGLYDLIALPLRLVGADGSPVRAVLRQSI